MQKRTARFLKKLRRTYRQPEFWNLVETARVVFTPQFANEINRHGDARIYVFMLRTWEGVDHIIPDANTIAALNETWNKTDRANFAGKAEFRWLWSEWDPSRGIDDPAATLEVEKALTALHESFGVTGHDVEIGKDGNPIGWAKLQRAVFDAMIAVLALLEEDGVFRPSGNRDQYTLYVTLTDSPLAGRLEKFSVEALNPKSVVSRWKRDKSVARFLAIPAFFRSIWSLRK